MSISLVCHRLSALIERIEASILAGILLFSALLLFANVLLRYLFLHPIFWAEELACYLMVWMIFLGSGKVAGGEGHISVPVLADRLPPGVRHVWDCVVTFLCLVFCATLTWYSLKHTLRVQSARQTTAALEIPMWLAYLSLTAGGASMTLRYAIKLVSGVIGGYRP